MGNPKKTLRHRHLKSSLRDADEETLGLELKKAIFEGTPWRIDAILDACASNESGGKAVRGALEDAAALGRLQIVEKMLAFGEQGFFKDKPEISFAFQRAVMHGHYRVATVLRDSGARAFEVQAGARQSPSAMSSAIRKGNTHAVRYLIDQLKKDEGFPQTLAPALETAIAAKRAPLVKLFVAEGADVNGGKRSETPLDAAVRTENMRVIKALLSLGARPDSTLGSEALFAAVERKNVDIVDLLVKNGANVAEQSKSLLSMAIHNNDFAMAEHLVARGADVNADQGMLVAEALLARHERAAEFFFANGADSEKASLAFDRIAKDPFLKYRMPGADIPKSLELLEKLKNASVALKSEVKPSPRAPKQG